MTPLKGETLRDKSLSKKHRAQCGVYDILTGYVVPVMRNRCPAAMKANAQIVETGVLRGEKFILERTIPNPPKVGASQKNRQLLAAGSDYRRGLNGSLSPRTRW
jgi:hypothetical protein